MLMVPTTRKTSKGTAELLTQLRLQFSAEIELTWLLAAMLARKVLQQT